MNIKIKNIKNIKDLDINAEGVSLIIAKGKNRVGKTTLSQCLRTVITQDAIKNAITTGEKEGEVTYKGKTTDGDDIVVKWKTSDDGDKFTATIVKDERTIRVTKKNDIRALTGQFFRYSSDEIFNMLSNEPGKKKFIKEFILSFLTDDQFVKYENLSKMLSQKYSESYYNERTNVNRRIKDLESILSKSVSVQWSPDELERINLALKLHDGVDYLRTQYSNDLKRTDDVITQTKGNIRRLGNEFNIDVDKCVEEIEETLNKYFSPYFERIKEIATEKKNELNSIDKRSKEEINEHKIKLLAALNMKEQLSSQRAEYGQLQARSNELEGLVSNTRESLSQLIKSANLPQGLSIVDGDVYLNDMPFQFDSISDSEARIMITELLCIINTSKFVDIGDITIFDSENFQKIIDIAKKHDCMLIAQKVTDDVNMKIEYDVEIKS